MMPGWWVAEAGRGGRTSPLGALDLAAFALPFCCAKRMSGESNGSRMISPEGILCIGLICFRRAMKVRGRIDKMKGERG